MNRGGTPANLIPGDSNPLRGPELDLVTSLYVRGYRLDMIAAEVDRPLGTIKTALTRLRAAGVIQYRYAGCARG